MRLNEVQKAMVVRAKAAIMKEFTSAWEERVLSSEKLEEMRMAVNSKDFTGLLEAFALAGRTLVVVPLEHFMPREDRQVSP